MPTVVHVTHEAIDKIGGIGAVLQGLLTSTVYLGSAARNILIGPYWDTGRVGDQRLGPDGQVLYSSMDGIHRSPLSRQLVEIEKQWGVRIVYGERTYRDPATGVSSRPQVILIDVSQYDKALLDRFKFELWKSFKIDSARYETNWDYEQWVRLAQPAIACLDLLRASEKDAPAVVLSHEYMGMPTALAAMLEPNRPRFRTIFYAHEVATARKIVEEAPGHDTMFYNVMRSAMAEGLYLQDVFGDQNGFYKHPLVQAARHCDGIFAVGDYTLKELKFLDPRFGKADARIAYNGLPGWKITSGEKAQSRRRLKAYCQTLLKFEPDFIFTHVTRLVPSKGLWRDLRVLEHVESLLRAGNESAVLFTLSTESPARAGGEIRQMEDAYHWPVAHREGPPDLSSGEAIYYQGVQEFNAQSRNVKVVFVNQFGWDQSRCGSRMSPAMDFFDLRKGTDLEFGQSIYEPFGIAQVEPISFGGISVFTNICGCAGFVEKAAGGLTPSAIVADYTDIGRRDLRPEQLLKIGRAERLQVEDRVAKKVAAEIVKRLPRSQADFDESIDRGFELARKMSWDAVAAQYVLPGIERACSKTK